jgi:hypothetical protein
LRGTSSRAVFALASFRNAGQATDYAPGGRKQSVVAARVASKDSGAATLRSGRTNALERHGHDGAPAFHGNNYRGVEFEVPYRLNLAPVEDDVRHATIETRITAAVRIDQDRNRPSIFESFADRPYTSRLGVTFRTLAQPSAPDLRYSRSWVRSIP